MINWARTNLFFRSSDIESVDSSVEQGNINRLTQIPKLLGRHGEIKPRKKNKTLEIELIKS